MRGHRDRERANERSAGIALRDRECTELSHLAIARGDSRPIAEAERIRHRRGGSEWLVADNGRRAMLGFDRVLERNVAGCAGLAQQSRSPFHAHGERNDEIGIAKSFVS